MIAYKARYLILRTYFQKKDFARYFAKLLLSEKGVKKG
jgi:hypothetical protein